MAMLKNGKQKIITELSDKINKSQAFFIVDYRGMSVDQITIFRKKLHPDSEFKVIKNSLALNAIKDKKEMTEGLTPHLENTNALVFAYGEPNEAAKHIVDYSKDVEFLDPKAGYFDGQILDKQKIKYLATIPSKDELRAQLLGVFQAPMAKFVRTLNEVPSSFVRVLAKHKDKQQ